MLENYKRQKFNNNDSLSISNDLVKIYSRRRTIREFSNEVPSPEIVLNAIDIARLAPSGANRQPWSFSLIHAKDMKKEIRSLAEKEEYKFYHEKPNKQWLDSLAHLHTNEEKAFIEEAPYLIAIFYKHYNLVDGKKESTNYYAKESVGIATGMLISSLHLSGLSVLTYTPSKMQFLSSYLDRPSEERTFMVLGVGLPKENVQVPKIEKKTLDSILKTYIN